MSKQFEKKQRILRRLDRLDQMLDDLFTHLEEIDHPQLQANPAPGKWSVLQILHHLIRAEKGSLGYVRKKMSFNPKYGQQSLVTRIRALSLNVSLHLPVKFKSPPLANPQDLPGETTLNETVLLWKSVRRELRAFVEMFDETLVDNEVYKHPYAGRLTLMDMLAFFENHFKRHRKQITRTLATVKRTTLKKD